MANKPKVTEAVASALGQKPAQFGVESISSAASRKAAAGVVKSYARDVHTHDTTHANAWINFSASAKIGARPADVSQRDYNRVVREIANDIAAHAGLSRTTDKDLVSRMTTFLKCSAESLRFAKRELGDVYTEKHLTFAARRIAAGAKPKAAVAEAKRHYKPKASDERKSPLQTIAAAVAVYARFARKNGESKHIDRARALCAAIPCNYDKVSQPVKRAKPGKGARK